MRDESTAGSSRYSRNLSDLARLALRHPAVSRARLGRGDAVIVQTRNSTYRLLTASDGSFMVQGGWFSRTNALPCRVEIAGCSFGGSALWEGVVAAPGLFLEFRNGVRTTRIQKVWVEPAGGRRSPN